MAQDEPKMAQDEPKMAPRGPKMAQHGPKMGPRWAQDGPKMGLKSVPRGLRTRTPKKGGVGSMSASLPGRYRAPLGALLEPLRALMGSSSALY